MISIITPSFRQLDWLRLAVNSVADQEGVAFEHIIQDGGTEGISNWASALFPILLSQQRLRLFTEKDAGMYDAINRGLGRVKGEVCAYLNCDEQYLPGALAHVAAEFRANPRLDVLLAGSLVIDGEGRYICSRPALKPSLRHLRAGKMYNLTSSIFFSARLIREQKIFFDPTLRIVGDREWFRQVVESGARIRTSKVTTSIFSDLGTNLALSLGDTSEDGPLQGRITWRQRLSSSAIIGSHRLRRLLAGQYHLPSLLYSIYTLAHPDERRTFEVVRPTGVWHNRLSRQSRRDDLC